MRTSFLFYGLGSVLWCVDPAFPLLHILPEVVQRTDESKCVVFAYCSCGCFNKIMSGPLISNEAVLVPPNGTSRYGTGCSVLVQFST
mmetsp:Transcript_11350/g.26340  ORF Transcript_11350/g.26340 Transcript_11350/m.26340 type:complete len:87 (-) Transcript_11350:337-597(-)